MKGPFQSIDRRQKIALFFAGASAIVVALTASLLATTGGLKGRAPVLPPFTPEQLREGRGSVASTAVAASAIKLSACRQDPAVAKVAEGAAVRFVNEDSVGHTLRFNSASSTPYLVPPKGELSIKFDFWKSPGARSYMCDGRTAPGFILITQQPK